MCTACWFTVEGVSLQRPPGQRPPRLRPPGQRPKWTTTPWTETQMDKAPQTETPRQRPQKRPLETPRRNMWPGSQTGSDIIQRHPCGQTDTCENITSPKTSFASDKNSPIRTWVWTLHICECGSSAWKMCLHRYNLLLGLESMIGNYKVSFLGGRVGMHDPITFECAIDHPIPFLPVLWTETPTDRDRDLPGQRLLYRGPLGQRLLGRNMGPSSQTRTDIIQRPPLWIEWQTHASENITLPQTSFAGGS